MRDGDALFLRYRGLEGHVRIALTVSAEVAKRGVSSDAGNSVRASMPGTVASLHVATGDRVAAGQVVAVLESMKLFMELKSPTAGTVSAIGTRAGATVAAGDVLVAIEPD